MSLYFRILKRLKKEGVNNDVDITYLFENEFLTPVDNPNRVKHDYRLSYLILPFLEKMTKDGHINYRNRSKRGDQVISNDTWIYDGYEFHAHLTADGLLYYQTYYSLINQRTFNVITWVIALISICVTGYFASISNSLSSEVQSMKKRLDTIELKVNTATYSIPKKIKKHH